MTATCVLLDAYSTTNLGDAELVEASVDAVAPTADRIVVLATDPDSFADASGGGVVYLYKPLSRVQFRRKSGLSRLAWLAADTFALSGAFLLSFLPIGASARSRASADLGRALRASWLSEIATAKEARGVGGGYLGDRYERETAVSLMQYRIALRCGVRVETLPISVSSLKSRRLRFLMRRVPDEMLWRAREETTESILRNATNGEVRLELDLAFRHRRPARAEAVVPRSRLLVAPVGSTFYSSRAGKSDDLTTFVRSVLRTDSQIDTVTLVPMHTYDERTGDGGDDRACDALLHALRSEFPRLSIEVVRPGSYAELIDIAQTSRAAVVERLHAAIACLDAGVPVKVIAYEPKHAGVLKTVDMAGSLEIGPQELLGE